MRRTLTAERAGDRADVLDVGGDQEHPSAGVIAECPPSVADRVGHGAASGQTAEPARRSGFRRVAHHRADESDRQRAVGQGVDPSGGGGVAADDDDAGGKTEVDKDAVQAAISEKKKAPVAPAVTVKVDEKDVKILVRFAPKFFSQYTKVEAGGRCCLEERLEV